MAATGVGVLYVTHHLGEIFRVAHKVSVFRDGVVVGSGLVKDFDQAGIIYLLAGEELLAEEGGLYRQLHEMQTRQSNNGDSGYAPEVPALEPSSDAM